MRSSKNSKFLKSALTEDNPFHSTQEALEWLINRNDDVRVIIEPINFDAMGEWSFTTDNDKFVHQSGKFFSIEGIKVDTNFGHVNSWEQPIINQPEVGYLGFLTKQFEGVLYFLTQAKIEPGNKNKVQLSPTLQATRSNYTRVHQGKEPKYLDYFRSVSRQNVLLDQLQSEQGARFLKKRNRNIIIETSDEIEHDEDFIWLTLGQLKQLMRYDNIVNMDARTVISGIPLECSDISGFDGHVSPQGGKFLASLSHERESLHSIDDILSWFTFRKCQYDLQVNVKPLADLKDWSIKPGSIHHTDNLYFKIIGASVEISNREITQWTQPLVQPAQEGLIAFIVKEINGLYHFLVQAKLECGNFDILEMAPTVQCLTGNYRNTASGALPYLEYILNVDSNQVIYDSFQSEEGGRFYHEQNRNLIIRAEADFDENLPDNYYWMSLSQLLSFIRFNNYLNIQARSLIAAVSYL